MVLFIQRYTMTIFLFHSDTFSFIFKEPQQIPMFPSYKYINLVSC